MLAGMQTNRETVSHLATIVPQETYVVSKAFCEAGAGGICLVCVDPSNDHEGGQPGEHSEHNCILLLCAVKPHTVAAPESKHGVH
jgi:hypothetical protein